MFVPLTKLLAKGLSRAGIQTEATAAHVCEVFRKIAPTIIHPQALDHIFPKFYKRGVLTIGVDHGAWAQLVLIHRDQLIPVLESHLRGTKIKGIKTSISELKNDFLPDLTG